MVFLDVMNENDVTFGEKKYYEILKKNNNKSTSRNN